MRRNLALSGFILGTCVSAITTILMILGGIVILEALMLLDGAELFIAIVIFEALFFIATLILNIVSISTTKNAKVFCKRKGLAITTIVFNFLAMGVYILAITTQGALMRTIIFYSILMVVLIVANILVIVDLAKNRDALEKENGQEEHIDVRTSQESVAQDRRISGIEEEINKLILLKEKNLITEEEFNELKKRTIEKRL